MTEFRNELFKLAKYLEKTELRKNIIDMRKNINETSETPFFSKSLFFTLGKEERFHFYGTLLLNNDLESGKTEDGILKKIQSLTEEEKELYMRGNQVMLDVFNELRTKLDFLPLAYQLALNPYSKLKQLDFEPTTEHREIELIEYDKLSTSFKSMILVENVKKKYIQIKDYFKELTFQEIMELLLSIEHEFRQFGFDNNPDTPQKISRKKTNTPLNKEEKIQDFFYSFYFLSISIELTLNTVFSSLIGKDLPLINEDNIIKIDSEVSDVLKKRATYLLINNGSPSYRIRNLVLMDYEIKKIDKKVHEFGYVYRINVQSGENGDTIKCSVLMVDECLNPYFLFDK
ncbi:hypothetical protein NAG46_002525 [Enterococcus faecium]|nr:hypothetical protein [Enterococcus faecium]